MQQYSTWKGENVPVQYKHFWLTKKYGRPQYCEHCGVKGEETFRKINYRWTIEWALKFGHQYTRNPEDYLKLCTKCHFKYDTANNRVMRAEAARKASLSVKNVLYPL